MAGGNDFHWGALALTAFAVCITTIAPLQALDDTKPLPSAIKMEFKDATLDMILDQLSDMTGLSIVKDAPLEGRLTIISKQAMTVDDAIVLLNSVLKEKGYVGIRTGKVLKLVKLDEAKKHNIPVRSGTDPDKMEETDEVITQVIQIKYVDAVQLKKDLAPLIPSYADLSANASSNTLLITDTTANVKRLMKIIAAMDTQTSTVSDVRVFQLKYANAASAARLINDIFKADTQTGNQQQNVPFFMRGGGFGRGGGGGGGGGGPGGGGGGGAAAAGGDAEGHKPRKVSASADERTNAVVVSAAPDTMKVIEGIIKDLDSNPAEEQAVFLYRIKNAQAKNLEGVLNTLFGTGSASSSRTSTTRQNQGIGQNVARTNSGFTGGGTGATAGSSQFGGGGGGSGGSTPRALPGFNQGGGGANAGGGSSNAVSGDLTGQVFVVADIDSNSLMVLTPTKNFARVKGVIEQLDRPIKQVVIKVLIAEVTHDKTDDSGADVSVLTRGAVSSVMSTYGNAAQTTGLLTKITDKDVTVALHALATEGKLEVLSRPYIVASDNQQSNITVGQEVPFVVSSRTTDTGQTVNTIQYQDIGIILNVTAHINDDGLVIMDVAPEVSSLTGQTVPISDTVSAPVFAKRSAQSRVGVHDGQTVVIGGLLEDKKTTTNQGIPYLRNLPGLGLLLGRKQKDKSKTELLIFLTPHVAQEAAALTPISEGETNCLKLVPHAVQPGTYDEHRDALARPGPIFDDTVPHSPDHAVPVEIIKEPPPPERPLLPPSK